MRFIKKLISTTKIFTIVDIGTYKIRCNIVEISKSGVKVLSYGEKKQDPEDFNLGEMIQVDKITKNIELAIKKAEKESNEQTKKIIVNTAGFKTFFSRESISFSRDKEKMIKKSELKEMLKNLVFSLKSKDRPLESGVYWTKDMKMIMGSISKIEADGKNVNDLLYRNTEKIDIYMSQFFIENSKHETLKKIANKLDKKIELIIPFENSVKDLINDFSDKKDYVAVNIGNRKTSIIVVKDYEIFDISYFNIGIGELIDEISKKYKVTTIKAIKTIDLDNHYNSLKDEFFDIWFNAFKITLSSICGNEVCPHDFFIFGGGYNNFIKDKLEGNNLNSHNIKSTSNIKLNYIDEDRKNFITGKFQLNVKANISLLSMIVSTRKYLKGIDNEMINMLMSIMKKS